MRHTVTIILILFTTLSGVWSQKAKDDASFIKRAYHNTTARYNGYYHANLRINQALKQVRSAVELNYTEMLPLYPYIDAEETKTIAPDMEEVIKKTSKVIKLHKISKWIDDCYLMLGKAYFLKKDFENAQKSFVYVTTHHKVDPPKSKRYLSGSEKFKRNVNDFLDRNGLSHQPVYFDAGMWLIHSYIAQNKLEKAQTIIDLMRSKEHFPDRLKGEINVLQTHLSLENDEIKKATEFLGKAIPHIEDSEKRARLTFTLAQLYSKIDKNKKAIDHYSKVLELQPPYEMKFYAKINMAKTYEQGGGMSMTSIKQQLKDLAKDDKNTEYLDQIYYLLAQLNLKEQDTSQAVEYLKKSVNNSIDNNRQKAISYLQLADLSFDQENYRSAKYYYDSTMTVLPQDYDNYETIKERKNILDELIKNILIVERQDSLLRLARMPESERQSIIDQKVAKKREELRQAQQSAQQNPGLNNNTPSTGYQVGNSQKWYFYNENAKQKGQQAFAAKWGDRELEDNWRRSLKSKSAQQQGNTQTGEDPAAQVDREQFINPIPLSSEEQEKAQQKIAEALFQIGVIYREDLNNKSKAIKNFERVNKRFDDHNYQVSSYFYLYLLYKEQGNTTKAQHYKNLILNQHPDSKIAKNLKNPNKQEESEQSKNNKLALKEYEKVYYSYEQGAYDSVIIYCNHLDSTLSPNPLQPKFDFLKALSYGHKREVAQYKTHLEKIVEKHKGHPVHERAKQLLERMDKKNVSELLREEGDKKSIYAYSPREEHFCVIILDPEVSNTNKLNIILSDFNKQFKKQELQVSNMMLNKKQNMIIVKSLQNAQKGQQYIRKLQQHQRFTSKIDDKKYNLLLISKSNFTNFYKDKNIDNYKAFYKNNYVQNN